MKKQPWWQACTCYQIYLPSFCDGNNDGLGDFPGLISRLDYLQALGIGAVWITPFYPSPLVDNGYDISDYCAVDARFGTLDDFRRVVDGCHARGIRVIIDLVVNHVSSEHPGFAMRGIIRTAAIVIISFFAASRITGVLSFPAARGPLSLTPANFITINSRPASGSQLGQPRGGTGNLPGGGFLGYAGVDGFRFDVINFLTTDGIGPDNPEENGEQRHEFDINQPRLPETLQRLCAHVRAQGDYFLIGEIGSEDPDVLSRYQSPQLMDVVFNFNIGSQKTFDVSRLFNQLKTTLAAQSGLPTLFFSSHDMSRMISRFGENERDTGRALAVLALQLTVSGVPFIFGAKSWG